MEDLLEHYETHHSEPVKSDPPGQSTVNKKRDKDTSQAGGSAGMITDQWLELES
jgi:hypothetical protein